MVNPAARRAFAATCAAALAVVSNARAGNYIDIDAGINYADGSISEPSPVDGNFDSGAAGYHLAVGAYRNKDGKPWYYGVKVEVADVVNNNLFSLRAFDFGYRILPRFALGGFLGAARYDLTTPATGWRVGLSASYWWSDHWALAADAAYASRLARDKLLPEENPGEGRPDIFVDIVQLNLYLKYKF
jgi:hypothetical protein